MSVSCQCCVFSRPFDWPIPCPEESYRMWGVVMCVLEASRMRRPWPALGYCPRGEYRCRRWSNVACIVLCETCGCGDSDDSLFDGS